MDINQITQTAQDAETLFKLIMNLYWTYLEGLETYIKSIPETETEILKDLYQHMQEVQNALEHDIGIFEDAIQSDTENLHQLQDQLKIDTIYKSLQ